MLMPLLLPLPFYSFRHRHRRCRLLLLLLLIPFLRFFGATRVLITHQPLEAIDAATLVFIFIYDAEEMDVYVSVVVLWINLP